MTDKALQIIETIVRKLFSGQFIVVVATTLTYCIIAIYTTMTYLAKASPDKVEGFCVGLVMGFASMAGIIYKSYFDRERPPFNNKEEK